MKILPSNSPTSLERLGVNTTSYNLIVENDFFFSWLIFENGEYLECGGGVQTLSHVWHFKMPRIVACQASLSLTISRSLLKLMSIESVILSNHLSTCYLFLLLLSIFPSIRVFSTESIVRIRWPKYGSFSFSISPSNEYSELISFRIDWFDLLAFQGTLKSLLQHHSSRALILWCSAFFKVLPW